MTTNRQTNKTCFGKSNTKSCPTCPYPTSSSTCKPATKRHKDAWFPALNLFPSGYLNQIHEEYRRFFHLYDNAPLLIANNDDMDFTDNDDHFELLLRTISHMQGNRHYLNLKDN